MTAEKAERPGEAGGDVLVKCFTPGTGEAASPDKKQEPAALVIFGASGDLTERKLIPALYKLFVHRTLPDPFPIVGCARTDMDHESFRDKMEKAVPLYCPFDPDEWRVFASRLFYQRIDYDGLSTFTALGGFLKDLEKRWALKGNRIYDLAIPPSLYERTIRMLGKAGLSEEGGPEKKWARIVIEKPFGHDLPSAMALDRTLHEHFQEHQIFRIDHYLAKETVQNILIFRFANAIFEPLWNRNYIREVSIMASETVGVEQRAGYYEEAGVLRDMFQNHMMQLLAVTAMEPPSYFDAARVRDEKVKVFRSLRPFAAKDGEGDLVLGQYGPGTVDGREAPAYREEPGVRPDSLTPTFAGLKVHIDNWRWQGVPFHLTSGKRLARKLTEIVIDFREVPHSLFRRILDERIRFNRLILRIQPEEKITMTFQTKKPGRSLDLRPVTMDFDYRQGDTGPLLDAYEKVLLDVLDGEQMLFWRQDGLELSWAFLTPVLNHCEAGGDRSRRLEIYQSGGEGPEAARDIMRRHGRQS